jgi:hypothetical protein
MICSGWLAGWLADKPQRFGYPVTGGCYPFNTKKGKSNKSQTYIKAKYK